MEKVEKLIKTNDLGRSVKPFDKVKIMHMQSNFILHSSEENRLQSGSYLQEVVCSKKRDDNDWFVVLPVDQDLRYPQYEITLQDKVVLYHFRTGQNLSCRKQFTNEKSKSLEINCSETNNDSRFKNEEDFWNLQHELKNEKQNEEHDNDDDSQDNQLRVGFPFLLQHDFTGCTLKSHNKKSKVSWDYEVIGSMDIIDEKCKWIITEIDPNIVTSNSFITQQDSDFKTAKQLQSKRQSYENSQPVPITQTNEKMKEKYEDYFQNSGGELEIQSKRRSASASGVQQISCWKRFFCCCCIQQPSSDDYEQHTEDTQVSQEVVQEEDDADKQQRELEQRNSLSYKLQNSSRDNFDL